MPDPKTGTQFVHLALRAVELLETAKRMDENPWVSAGALKWQRLSERLPFCQSVLVRVGVKGVRIQEMAAPTPPWPWLWARS
jgi:hypothetical protein